MKAATRAMGRAAGRRALFKASRVAGGALGILWQFLIMLVPILACSVMFSAISGLWWDEGRELWMTRAGAPIAIALLLGWGAFDTARADRGKLFANVDWSRPLMSLATLSLGGFGLMADRAIWALRGVDLGVTRRWPAMAQPKSWKGVAAPSTASGCVEPLMEELRFGWDLAKRAPAWTMTMAWGMASIAPGLPLMLLAALEEWAIGAWGKGRRAVMEAPKRARAAMEELANEGAEDLAAAERADLAKAAEPGRAKAPEGPRSGL